MNWRAWSRSNLTRNIIVGRQEYVKPRNGSGRSCDPTRHIIIIIIIIRSRCRPVSKFMSFSVTPEYYFIIYKRLLDLER